MITAAFRRNAAFFVHALRKLAARGHARKIRDQRIILHNREQINFGYVYVIY